MRFERLTLRGVNVRPDLNGTKAVRHHHYDA
jgi:hypothetical protein